VNKEAAINMIKKGIEILENEICEDEGYTFPVELEEPGIGIAFIIGHTANAKGAYSDYFQESEYGFWYDREHHFDRECLDLGISYKHFTRDGVGVVGAYREADIWLTQFEKKCVVELHFNSAKQMASGCEVLYVHDTAKEGILAVEVSYAMSNVLRIRDRGAKNIKSHQDGYTNVTQIASYPSILLEPFFGNNPEDCKAFERNKELFYRNVVLAIKNYL